jgi:hypothetical protein
VSATEPSKGEFHTYIHALNLATGEDQYPPQEISPSAKYANGSDHKFDSKNQWSRAGLAYNNGSVFVSIGAHCDGVDNVTPLSGWVLRYSENLDLKGSFSTIGAPRDGLAGVWMTGVAPAVDEAGNLFVITGNGDFGPPDGNYAESVLKLKR